MIKYTKNPKPIEGVDYFPDEKPAEVQEATEAAEETAQEAAEENVVSDAKTEE